MITQQRSLISLVLVFVATPVKAQEASNSLTTEAPTVTVTISCFRGPLDQVIWDRPKAEFIDDLVGIGYSYANANAIGERICADQEGVSDPQYLRAHLISILRSFPAAGQ